MPELSDERLRELAGWIERQPSCGIIDLTNRSDIAAALRELLARREHERAEAAAVEQAVAPIRARLERVVAAMSRRPDDD